MDKLCMCILNDTTIDDALHDITIKHCHAHAAWIH